MRVVLKFLMAVVMGVVLLALLPYYQTKIYEFPEPQPFSGGTWYNPYEGIDSAQWKLGNFHTHSRAYGGLTNGVGTEQDFYDRYKQIGYDFVFMSNYMNPESENYPSNPDFNVYEHGYGITKNHHVVINASEANWIEFPLLQTRHHEQTIIEALTQDSNDVLVALAHPKFRDSYSKEDMPYLSGYDLMEVLNHYYFGLEHWDIALSAGKRVFLLADDDAHDFNGLFEIGMCGTILNMESIEDEQITDALRKGRSIGFHAYTPTKVTWDFKTEHQKKRERLKAFEVSGGNISLEVSGLAKEIRFIGQGGEVKKTVENAKTAEYALQEDDTYIRTEIDFKSKNVFYLNPVFRYTEGEQQVVPTVRAGLTWLHHVILTFLLLLIYVPAFRFVFKKRS